MAYNLYWTAAFAPSLDTVGWRPPENLVNASNIASSTAGPALASAFGKMWCVHNDGAGHNVLWSLTFDQNNGWGQSETSIPNNSTNNRPALTFFKDRLYCTYMGLTDTIWQISTASDIQWTNPPFAFPNTASSGPATENVPGNLWTVYRGTDNNLYCKVANTHQIADNWTTVGPAVANFVSKGVWCVFRSGKSEQLFVTTSGDSINWTPSNSCPALPNALTDAEPALVYLPQENIMFCVYGGGPYVWYTYNRTGDPSQWSAPKSINGASRAAGTGVGLTVYNDIVFVAYCGTS